MFKTSTVLGASLIGLLGTLPFDSAFAEGIRIKCEKRAARSSISVDGRDLMPGNYSSVVFSGDNVAAAPLTPSIGDEVEFDYDSKPDDIAAGETAISSDFIQGGKVTGQIVDENGYTVVQGSARCRIR